MDAPYDVLETVSCTVCMNVITPPVRQCTMGHLICTTCLKGLGCLNANESWFKCPTCRHNGPTTRNLAVENIMANFKVPCAHTGCTIRLPYSDLHSHSLTCKRRYPPFQCPRCGVPRDIEHMETCLRNLNVEELVQTPRSTSYNLVVHVSKDPAIAKLGNMYAIIQNESIKALGKEVDMVVIKEDQEAFFQLRENEVVDLGNYVTNNKLDIMVYVPYLR